jgi:hypothetical protein
LPAAQAGLLAFALQIRQNHGLQNVALLRSLCPTASATIAMPLPRTSPPLFCLILAEAVLLTVRENILGSINIL